MRAADCRVLSLRRMNSAGNKASGRRGRRGFGRRHPLRTAGFLLLWAHQLAEGERIFGNGKACRGYHLNLNTQDGCTNNGNYPPQWTSPDQIDRMFFDLAGDCCKFFFPNAACEVYNVCEEVDAPDIAGQEPGNTQSESADIAEETAPPAPASTTGTISTATYGNGEACRGYHLNLSTQDGCTNNGNYPPQWTSPDQIDRMFFDLAGDCCKFFFPNAACEVTNVCEDEV